MQSIRKNFIVRKSILQELANFDDYLGDFRLLSGDQEKSKGLDLPLEGTCDDSPKNVTTRLIIVTIVERNSSRPYFSHFFLGCCLQRYSKLVSFY